MKKNDTLGVSRQGGGLFVHLYPPTKKAPGIPGAFFYFSKTIFLLNVSQKHVRAVIFGVEPENDAAFFEGEAFFEGVTSGAGEYAAIFGDGVGDQVFFDV